MPASSRVGPFQNPACSYVTSSNSPPSRRFVYAHAWQLHDLVVWDNRSTMHRGRRFDPAEARDVRQTRLAGDFVTVEQFG